MNTDRIYLLTGAAGFLGSNICSQLLDAGCKVRALVLRGDKSVKFIPKDVEVVFGDLTDADSLEPFFAVPEGVKTAIIHCASMVTVDPAYSEKLMAVNVGGTRNMQSVIPRRSSSICLWIWRTRLPEVWKSKRKRPVKSR